MKKIILLLCFYGCLSGSYSQNSNTFYPILDECISYCIDSLPEIFTQTIYKIDYVLADDYPRYYKLKFLEHKNIQLVTLLPRSILSLHVKRKMQKIYRKDGVYVMMYDGINLAHDTLRVSFSFRCIQRTRKETWVAISDGITFHYCYSPLEEKWVCVRKEIWGI
jgi:hypothetical protein